jgi:OTU domain-containing protein 6
VAKEVDRQAVKQELMTNALLAPNHCEIELNQINIKLQPLGLRLKDIKADGHCLYRAIADQWNLINGIDSTAAWSYVQMRRLAAEHMRGHAPDFAPFLGFEAGSSEYEQYCK